jgi:hypothetical protein
MPLTDVAIRALKPEAKRYNRSNERGWSVTGTRRWWRRASRSAAASAAAKCRTEPGEHPGDSSRKLGPSRATAAVV